MTSNQDVSQTENMFAGAFEKPTSTVGSPPNEQPRKSSEPTPHLNPRSCTTCRKRKVRCDKHEPCGNCVKAAIDCHFPAPGRAPRRPRKLPDAELIKRLRRLEGVVQSLGAQVDDQEAPKEGSSSPPSRNPSIDECMKIGDTGNVDKLPLGRLVISHGRSRYVNNSFWASIGSEIADIRDVLDQSESDDEDVNSPESSLQDLDTNDHRGFIFGYSSLAVDMKKLYPSPSQIFIIWEVFKENVDPVVKIIHVPTVKKMILKAAVNTDTLSRPAEALFFAMCFGATVSMTEDQTQSLLGESKTTLWRRYRFATEQALARADFLNSSSLMVLQAFIFFLVTVRYNDDSKSTWALGGLAMQQSFMQGIHRDGTHFGLDHFEVEMRRRLWWHISMLDVRAAEDHGTELRTTQTAFDTKLPLNINDEDIWPGMPNPPQEHDGPTEMTFCLIRFQLSAMTRQLNLYNQQAVCSMQDHVVEAKERLIDKFHSEIEDKYLKTCNMNVPIYWVAATVGRLILAKMWLKLHHPRLSGQGLHDHPEIRERVFTTSVEVMEFGHLLESNENTAKWAWLFRTYMQWHAVAYVLSELSVRPPGPAVDRAWKAVETVYEESEHSKKQRGMLWKPIRHLMIKARANQAKGTQGVQAVPSSTTAMQVPRPHNSLFDVNGGKAPKSEDDEKALGMNFLDADVINGTSESGMDFSNMNSFTNGTNIDLTSNGNVNGNATFNVVNTPSAMNRNMSMESSSLSPGTLAAMGDVTSGSTPDFLMWDGWSPDLGQMPYGGQPSGPGFPWDNTAMPQEWF